MITFSRRFLLRAVPPLALGGWALTTLGCGTRLTVLRAAPPDPYPGVTELAIASLSLEGVRVGGREEGEWLSHADEELRADWPAARVALAAGFSHGVSGAEHPKVVAAPGRAGSHTLVARAIYVEPGAFGGATSIDTVVTVRASITTPREIVIDELEASATIAATAINPSFPGRLRSAGSDVGAKIARYLEERFR